MLSAGDARSPPETESNTRIVAYITRARRRSRQEEGHHLPLNALENDIRGHKGFLKQQFPRKHSNSRKTLIFSDRIGQNLHRRKTIAKNTTTTKTGPEAPQFPTQQCPHAPPPDEPPSTHYATPLRPLLSIQKVPLRFLKSKRPGRLSF